jgi:hypothetical protein
MAKPIPKVGENEIWCPGCERAKFRGLFSPSQQKCTPGEIRCMKCVAKRRPTRKFKRGENWRGHARIFLRGST